MTTFDEFSPTQREENQPHLHPALRGIGFTWIVLYIPHGQPPVQEPDRCRMQPQDPQGDVPLLQLPPVAVPLRQRRVWRLGHGQRMRRAPRTPGRCDHCGWLSPLHIALGRHALASCSGNAGMPRDAVAYPLEGAERSTERAMLSARGEQQRRVSGKLFRVSTFALALVSGPPRTAGLVLRKAAPCVQTLTLGGAAKCLGGKS